MIGSVLSETRGEIVATGVAERLGVGFRTWVLVGAKIGNLGLGFWGGRRDVREEGREITRASRAIGEVTLESRGCREKG